MNNTVVLHQDGSNIIYITSFYQLIPFSFAIYYYMIGIGSLLYPIEYKIPKNNYYRIAICHSLLQIIACNICVCICYDINNKLIEFKKTTI